MSFCLQGCPKILTYWSLQDELQIDPLSHAWGSRGSSGAGKTAAGSGRRKGGKVLLLRCCLWAWAWQSRRFSPGCPASLVWLPVTTCGWKCLCAGVVSGAKVLLLVQRNAVSAARSQKRQEFDPWCFEWVEGIGNTDGSKLWTDKSDSQYLQRTNCWKGRWEKLKHDGLSPAGGKP